MSLEKTYQMLAEHRRKKEEEAMLKMQKQKEEDVPPPSLEVKKIEKPSKIWSWWNNNETNSEDEESEPTLSNRSLGILYVIGQGFTIWAQFGLVFFIFSLIVLLYLNTGRRKRGELSAYSVFNEQCERLPGQMTAEHFERDMLRQRRDN